MNNIGIERPSEIESADQGAIGLPAGGNAEHDGPNLLAANGV